MTIDELFEALEQKDVFPGEAIEAAIAQKEAVAPRLIEKFEAIATDPNALAKATNSFYPITFLYLLAGFREKKALPTVLKVLSLPGDALKKLFHYVLEDALVSILCAMFDGNTDALVEVILQPNTNQDVVIAAGDTITMAFFDGVISREEMLRAYGRLLKELSPDAPATVWRPVICSAAEAQARELLPEIKTAFERLNARDPIPEDELSIEILKRKLGAAPHQVRADFREIYPKIDDPFTEIQMQWDLGPIFDDIAEAADELMPDGAEGEEEEFVDDDEYFEEEEEDTQVDDTTDDPAMNLTDIVPSANPPVATPEIEAILRRLSWRRKVYPRSAVRYALKEKEAITPHLISALENVIANAEAFSKKPRYVLHHYALFLLAQFRDARAFPLAVRLATFSEAVSEKLTGAIGLDDWDCILVSVCGDRLEPLADLGLNREALPRVRGAAIQAMPLLGMEKIVPRESLLQAYTRIFDQLTDDDGPEAWGSLLVSVAYSQIHELMPRVIVAHQKGYGEDWVPSMAELKNLFSRSPESVAEEYRSTIYWMTDVFERMEYSDVLYGASIEDEAGEWDRPIELPNRENGAWIPPTPPTPPQPIKRTEPKVGRNDPCPCGSGKKYKKCCLGKEE